MKILFLRGAFLLTILLSIQIQLIGQISTFELKAYKLTDVRLQSFTNQLYFDQNGYENKNMFNGTKLSSNNQLSVDYSGTYSLYKNTRPFQRITRVILDFDGYRSMNKVENQNAGPNIWRSYRWNTGAEYNDVFRKYLNPKLFIETQFLAKYRFDQYYSYTRQFNVQVLKVLLGKTTIW